MLAWLVLGPVLVKRQGRNVKGYRWRRRRKRRRRKRRGRRRRGRGEEEEECSYAFHFLPAPGRAQGQDCAGKSQLPERRRFSGWAGPDPADTRWAPGACISVIVSHFPPRVVVHSFTYALR